MNAPIFPEHWSRTPTWQLVDARRAIRLALPGFPADVREAAESQIARLDAYLNPILSRAPTAEEIEEAHTHA